MFTSSRILLFTSMAYTEPEETRLKDEAGRRCWLNCISLSLSGEVISQWRNRTYLNFFCGIGSEGMSCSRHKITVTPPPQGVASSPPVASAPPVASSTPVASSRKPPPNRKGISPSENNEAKRQPNTRTLMPANPSPFRLIMYKFTQKKMRFSASNPHAYWDVLRELD